MTAEFFATPSELRAWLARHQDRASEVWIGFYKKKSGKPSITWPEAVDVALCFGWIDGVRKSINETSYAIRLTPRKPRSTWSAINIKKAQELIKLGLMHSSGLQAFQSRAKERSAIYSTNKDRRSSLIPRTKKSCVQARKRTNFSRHNPLGIREHPSFG